MKLIQAIASLGLIFLRLCCMIVTQQGFRRYLAWKGKLAKEAKIRRRKEIERRKLIDGGAINLKHRWKLW